MPEPQTDQPPRPRPLTKGQELVRQYRDSGSGIVWEPAKMAAAIDKLIREGSRC